MGKYKFTEKDFEKPGDSIGSHKSKWWKKPIGISALLAVLGVGGYGTYSLLHSDKSQPQPQPIDTIKTNPTSKDSDSIFLGELKNPSGETASNDTQEKKDSLSIKQEEKGDEKLPQSDVSVIQSDLSGTLEEKAKRVIRGDFGNGQERKDKLGTEYRQIQDKVNELYRKGDIYM